MITAYLIGRLGNAMFQIASVYALAKDNGDVCAFSLKAFERYRNNIFRNVKELPELWKEESCYVYKSPHYKPIPYQEGMAVVGYFQSDKYFDRYKSDLIDLFSVDTERILNSVSIHVRRGDYLQLQFRHLFPGIDYYNNALAYVDSKKKIDRILVMSDDLIWCKENFTDKRVEFVDEEDYIAFQMMSNCENNIIANSSFSWWASYLNKNEGIVIAPKIWVKDQVTPDIFRKEMILL